MKNIFVCLLFISLPFCVTAQLLDVSWRTLVETKPLEGYASDSAKELAETVLLLQRDNGGWIKNYKMHSLTENEKAALLEDKSESYGTTIDNGATYLEMEFLAKSYTQKKDERYRQAYIEGLNYLLEAQYDNGGWPQFYPLRKGYYSHITYNDNAMAHVMELLFAVIHNDTTIAVPVNDSLRQRCQTAFEKGVDCILKTQYRQNGVLTGWCAQHDEVTFEPAAARSYELISLSGQESAGILLLLMKIENPSEEVKTSINSAIAWLEKTKITGLRQERYYTPEGLREKRMVPDLDAKPMWSRFMELRDNTPFFCDRDGVKKPSMFDIGQERRNGYAWYTTAPNGALKAYKKWKEKNK